MALDGKSLRRPQLRHNTVSWRRGQSGEGVGPQLDTSDTSDIQKCGTLKERGGCDEQINPNGASERVHACEDQRHRRGKLRIGESRTQAVQCIDELFGCYELLFNSKVITSSRTVLNLTVLERRRLALARLVRLGKFGGAAASNASSLLIVATSKAAVIV